MSHKTFRCLVIICKTFYLSSIYSNAWQLTNLLTTFTLITLTSQSRSTSSCPDLHCHPHPNPDHTLILTFTNPLTFIYTFNPNLFILHPSLSTPAKFAPLSTCKQVHKLNIEVLPRHFSRSNLIIPSLILTSEYTFALFTNNKFSSTQLRNLSTDDPCLKKHSCNSARVSPHVKCSVFTHSSPRQLSFK